MSELMKIAAAEQPAKRKSKLDPHLADLRRLQEEGYSLDQMRELLKKIGIEVTRQSIYDFLKRRRSTAPAKTEGVATETTDGLNSKGVIPKPATKAKPDKALDVNSADVKTKLQDLPLNPDLSLSEDFYETFKKKD